MSTTSFAQLAARSCPPLDGMALAVTAELLGRVDEDAADRWLDELGLELMLAAGAGTPAGQAAALTDVLAALRPVPATAPPRRAHFALDAVLAGGAGHPAVLAVAAAEIARRAGLAFALVGHGNMLLLAHARARVPVVVDPARAAQVPLAQLPETLRFRCSHQAAYSLLTHASAGLAAAGDLAAALVAAELRLALPVEPDARTALEHELAALRARLN